MGNTDFPGIARAYVDDPAINGLVISPSSLAPYPERARYP